MALQVGFSCSKRPILSTNQRKKGENENPMKTLLSRLVGLEIPEPFLMPSCCTLRSVPTKWSTKKRHFGVDVLPSGNGISPWSNRKFEIHRLNPGAPIFQPAMLDDPGVYFWWFWKHPPERGMFPLFCCTTCDGHAPLQPLQNSQPKCQWNPKTSPDIPLTTYFQPPANLQMRCDIDASRNLCTPNPPLPVQAWQRKSVQQFGFPTRSILSDLNSPIYRNSPSKFSLQRQDLWNLLGVNGKHEFLHVWFWYILMVLESWKRKSKWPKKLGIFLGEIQPFNFSKWSHPILGSSPPAIRFNRSGSCIFL